LNGKVENVTGRVVRSRPDLRARCPRQL